MQPRGSKYLIKESGPEGRIYVGFWALIPERYLDPVEKTVKVSLEVRSCAVLVRGTEPVTVTPSGLNDAQEVYGPYTVLRSQ